MEHAEFTPIDAILHSGVSQEKLEPPKLPEIPLLEEGDSETDVTFSPPDTIQPVTSIDRSIEDSVRKSLTSEEWKAIMEAVEDDRYADKGRGGV